MKTFLIIFGVVVVAFIGATAYYGGFHRIQVQVAETGGETIVYDTILGDYSQSKMVMDRIYEKLLDDYQIEAVQGIGIYYDDPEQTPTAKLRSDAGCVLPEAALGRVQDLQADFMVKTLEKKEYLVAEFPFRGGVSVFLNIMKTYPALEKFARENDYNTTAPIIELYDMTNKKIIVRMEATLMRT